MPLVNIETLINPQKFWILALLVYVVSLWPDIESEQNRFFMTGYYRFFICSGSSVLFGVSTKSQQKGQISEKILGQSGIRGSHAHHMVGALNILPTFGPSFGSARAGNLFSG